VIFGRKNRAAAVSEPEVPEPDAEAVDEPEDGVLDPVEAEVAPAAEDAEDDDGWPDPREYGPFDASEVELSDDPVTRLALGPITVTPFPGMGLQFQGDPQTQTIYSALVMHENSALQLELFAAPTSGGLADELREDTLEEAQQQGGNAEVQDGPFGQEIKRVLPLEGPEGEQLFHVSRIWFVDGPRWLLRGTLMGQASLVDGEEAPADVFAEFFRNIVVHRDDSPRVPGELLTLTLPDLPAADLPAAEG
jgi:hypothetical protein